MNKRDLIEATYDTVNTEHGTTRAEVVAVVEKFLELIEDCMYDGEKVTLSNFCRFTPVDVAARPRRKGVNPFTREETTFKAKPATTRVRITAAKALRDTAAQGRRSRARRAA